MSRRKQAKPQHLKSDGEAARSGLGCSNDVVGDASRDDTSEDAHICDKCCAQFFTWAELREHQTVCTEDPLVLIVKDSEGTEESPVGASPVPSVASSESSAAESTDAGFELGETLVNDNDSLDNLEEGREREDAMELEHCPQDTGYAPSAAVAASSPPPPDSAESTSPQMSAAAVYGMPSTNVTLEILHSTRVAVAQFSQGIGSGGLGGKAASAAIPVILEHLLALQQQQVHQLQLIEQICSQVAVMNRQPTQAALNPASGSLPLPPRPFPSPGVIPPSILPLSGTMPSSINGQAAVSLSSVLEKSQNLPSQTICGQSAFRDATCTSASSENSTPTLSSCSGSSSGGGSSSVPTLLPPYSGPLTSSISSAQTLSSSSPLPLAQSSLLGSSASLPFLPQSPPSSVIFPNPLASIAATANALDPLAALMKHRKGKLPNVSLFESKPSPEEPFFKHKCRFCAKVFGSDSALQIHLRSHTGERPFKCNICGNRFSTKGNLKVHFQRHKEKYPHVQMNPFPVPEYLDNVPTSSGIPYGMSIPPEKPVSSWLDSKPVVATLPASMGLPLSSTITSMGGSNDPVSVTPSVKSPYQPAAGECVSLSPNHRGSEAHFSPVSESPQSNRETEASNIVKTEGTHRPPSCTLRQRADPEAPGTTSPEPGAPHPHSPASDSSPFSLSSEEMKFPPGSLLDSMQTSETSKLQQLVENIDKKITDPNQCVLCHRVLSCQSALKMHYRIHTGERPFKCKVCGRAFTTKGNLKTHVGVHRENPPVQVQHSCPICQKKFTNAVVLQQHIRMHMIGRISDSPLTDGPHEVDAFDSVSSGGNDDMLMEEDNEEEDEDVETMEEVVNTSDRVSPTKSFAVVSSIAALENQMKMINCTVNLNNMFGIKHLTNGFKDTSVDGAPLNGGGGNSPRGYESPPSPGVAASPFQGSSEGAAIKSSAADSSGPESREPPVVKREQSESPTSASAQEARGGGGGGGGAPPAKLCVKEEAAYSLSFQLSRERGQSVPSFIASAPSGAVKAELNGHAHPPHGLLDGHHPHTFGVHVAGAYPSVGSPGVTSLLGPAPPRRTAKQHNCNACGKNFSSASALQIHERTHTGEKPFVCSICGRAFTTKGNLKVHMGTHMWNNAPARRGRRLSVENPMALLGGEAVKFGEMFQKDLAARAMNVDPGFWNRYATAISNSLAMKNNEISVIQNRGIAQLHPLTAGMDRAGAAGGPMAALTKTAMDLGNNRHFSMLIDDSKEIGIN